MDDEAEGMPGEEGDVAMARQDVVGAIDGDWHKGQLEFVGQEETSATEGAHGAAEGACPLGEDGERDASLEHLMGLGDGASHGGCIATVDHDVSGCLAGWTDEEHVAQGVLHHPAEAVGQVSEDEEDIVGSLMVGTEDVGGVWIEVLVSLHANGQQHEAAHGLAPPAGWPVAPKFGASESAAKDGGQDCEERAEEQDGDCYEELVEDVEDAHHGVTIVRCYGLRSLTSVRDDRGASFWPSPL